MCVSPDVHPEELSLFSKKKLPWVGFEPTTVGVLGGCSLPTELPGQLYQIQVYKARQLTGELKLSIKEKAGVIKPPMTPNFTLSGIPDKERKAKIYTRTAFKEKTALGGIQIHDSLCCRRLFYQLSYIP